jgi:prepilin-type N-terminal cleavage/methylation domain-containing protein
LAYKLLGNKGFTLLEVMLVVLIIGIVTSFAVYSMTPIGPGRHAILSHQPYGLVIDKRGYQFYVYQGSEQGQWQTTQSLGLNQTETLSQIKLILPKRHLDGSPSIVLLPSKEPQVYTIEVNLDGYGWQLRSLPPKPLTLIAMPHE